ncbi:unnamed protein product [Spirodela intermedia]|uniref:RNA polymerase sigma-70 region 4 domain-containing protein n=1 Tax=Spirodela intermedia TaxID=51605 RepID=A0A7I8JN94_SPIIN|nr:unnamed protein product [Spirodela intermedia]CAA6671647.1 unnamed protein product [Spirodela intermedia]
MMKNETEDASSSYNLRFSLLMENLNEIEDILVDSDMLRLQRDILMQDVAKLERIRDELEERTGRASSFSRWAEAAGTDERTLQQRLHFGWYCKDSLLKSTRSLVIYLARSYRGMGIAFDDLIQQRIQVSTYVQYWIRKSMLAVVGRYSRGIHIPATMEKAIKQVQKARRTLSTAKHRRPLDADVAELTGLSLAKETMADVTIRTPEEAVMRQHMRNDVDKLLESLHPRERQVLLLRYGMVDGRRRSLEEIGQLLHVSKEWIRKLEIAGLAKVRKEEIQRELKHYIHPHSI